MPSNTLSIMASRAKAHHESLNSAFSTYYAPGSTSVSRSSSTNSNSNSNSNSKPSSTTSSKKGPTNAAKAWAAIKKHHHDMNEAYTVFYSPGASAASSRANSAATSPRHSADAPHQDRPATAQNPRNGTKLWNAIKTRAVEHHRSVNAAYARAYGLY